MSGEGHDRIGRNSRNALDLIEFIESKGATFRSLIEGISTSGPVGKAMLTIMAAFAQLERDIIVERTNAGLASAGAGPRGGVLQSWTVRRSRRSVPCEVRRAHP